MHQEVRRKKIESYLNEVEFASLEELAERVEASVSTVRRDLTSLEETGNIQRTHGGARLARPQREDLVFSNRKDVEAESKQRIAKACAEIIQPNQNLFLDAGSTVYFVAQELEDRRPHIVTNSLPIANLYASHPEIELVLSGGVVYPRLQVMVGPLAVQAFEQLSADVAIMGGGGLTEAGVFNSHLLLVEQQKAMLRNAQKVIFCLDHTKIGRKSFTFLCPWEAIDVLITNREADKAIIREIKRQNVEVILA